MNEVKKIVKYIMKSAICTLFEGDYHFGVGALTNSLYHHGFRGIVWAGYRGELPPWAKPIEKHEKFNEYIIAKNCAIRFVKLDTSYHLTNYKPDFMLSLWNEFCPDTEALFYFDPDIVIKCRWSYFEEWASYGVAFCQEINWQNMSDNHPKMMGLKEFSKQLGLERYRESNRYYNAGFIGVQKNHISILELWKNLIECLGKTQVDLSKMHSGDPTSSIYTIDQDLFNLSVILTNCPISTIGPEGMDFIPGGFTMSHAAGATKPWRKKMFLSALMKKQRPSLADRGYWRHTQTPIKLYSDYRLFLNNFDLFLSIIIGRLIC